MLVIYNPSRKAVGPTARNTNSSNTLSQMFSSLRKRTPRPTPDTADRVPRTVTAVTRINWLILLTSIPNRKLKPAFTAEIPNPSEVASPKTVPKTAIRSTAETSRIMQAAVRMATARPDAARASPPTSPS